MSVTVPSEMSAPTHLITPSAESPYPGSREMPRWNVGELPPAPVFTWRSWFAFLGPGLLMGGAAIGGGEWLTGPIVTARYGGNLLWLATISILCQLIYNIEISRYTLYTGEPIFTGKFRILPGPMFWVGIYLLLDFGSVFPYLAASCATPVAALWLGHIPDSSLPAEKALLKGLGIGIFLICLIPLIFGGKIYNSLKAVMTFKIFTVMGFLLLLALGYSHARTWYEISSGFLRFGNVPVERGEDLNGNGILDPGEDWDGDGHLDVVEPRLPPSIASTPGGPLDTWERDAKGRLIKFQDLDADGYRDGDNVSNIFVDLYSGRGLPLVDFGIVAFLSTLVAISGGGGLTNTPISNYTRDQGWGMGKHVGAIPSIIGGRDVQLSHEGTVFLVTPQSLTRWRQWVRHVVRDQCVLWMPACFVGLALPTMLSVEFLRRGTETNEWVAAGMTADAVGSRVGGSLGAVCWFMTLFCGFLVLAPTMASTIDGVVRRWVDVFWTASRRLRSMDPGSIRYVYFAVLTAYTVFGVSMLALVERPTLLMNIAANFYNIAFGFSCWHVLVVNTVLLPKELRPNWGHRIALVFSGLFFWIVAAISATKLMVDQGWIRL